MQNQGGSRFAEKRIGNAMYAYLSQLENKKSNVVFLF